MDELDRRGAGWSLLAARSFKQAQQSQKSGVKSKGAGEKQVPSLHTHMHAHGYSLQHKEDKSKREQVLPVKTLTHTIDSRVVQVVPEGALAAEGPISINAGPIYADTQVL